MEHPTFDAWFVRLWSTFIVVTIVLLIDAQLPSKVVALVISGVVIELLARLIETPANKDE